jgi:hypothetical protein
MNPEVQTSEPAKAEIEVERRKHTRHRYIERLYIGGQDGLWYTAMTFEISEGGLWIWGLVKWSNCHRSWRKGWTRSCAGSEGRCTVLSSWSCRHELKIRFEKYVRDAALPNLKQ